MDEKLMTLPVIALRGLTVLPEIIQHFDISRDKSISAVEHAMVGEQKVFLVTLARSRRRIPMPPACSRSVPSPGSSSW